MGFAGFSNRAFKKESKNDFKNNETLLYVLNEIL